MKRSLARFSVFFYAILLCAFFVCESLNAANPNTILADRIPRRPTTDVDDVKGKVGSLAGTIYATQAELLSLGTVWQVTEADGWTGTWTRRAGKNVFDAKWRHSNGTTAQDVITLVSWNKTTGKITLKRQMGEYSGTLNVQNRRITQGTTTWYARGQTWSASY